MVQYMLEKLDNLSAACRSDVAALSTPTFQNDIGSFIGELGVPNSGFPPVDVEVEVELIATVAEADFVESA